MGFKRPRTLSATFVRSISRPGRYGDGRGGFGLSLLVKPTANGRVSKTWSQRVRINGKPSNIGLGGYPLVTLAEARAAALKNARTVRAGKDPRRGGGVPTFAQAAEKVIGIYGVTFVMDRGLTRPRPVRTITWGGAPRSKSPYCCYRGSDRANESRIFSL